MGLRDQIIQVQDRTYEVVHVPEWNMDIRIRSLTAKERDKFEADCINFRQEGRHSKTELRGNNRARLCVMCIVDDAGQRVFKDEDAEVLGAKSAKALDRIYAVAQSLGGISSNDIDELEKNFDGTQAGDSPID